MVGVAGVIFEREQNVLHISELQCLKWIAQVLFHMLHYTQCTCTPVCVNAKVHIICRHIYLGIFMCAREYIYVYTSTYTIYSALLIHRVHMFSFVYLDSWLRLGENNK